MWPRGGGSYVRWGGVGDCSWGCRHVGRSLLIICIFAKINARKHCLMWFSLLPWSRLSSLNVISLRLRKRWTSNEPYFKVWKVKTRTYQVSCMSSPSTSQSSELFFFFSTCSVKCVSSYNTTDSWREKKKRSHTNNYFFLHPKFTPENA